jgi:hypothetical protein
MERIPALTSTASGPDAAGPRRVVLGRGVLAAQRSAGGYTAGWRGVVTLDDGQSVFVKTAAGLDGGPIRREAKVLASLQEQGHVGIGPRLLDFVDGDGPTLVLEDLSAAYWPPPYPADTDPLFATLSRLGQIEGGADLEGLEAWAEGQASRWALVAENPTAFLKLGVCEPDWLDRNVASLIDAERRIDLRGGSLVHNDVHSGNVCFVGDRALLLDWATAARGNPDLDVAFAVVSVLAEGGQLPKRQLLADEAAWAARLAGHNAVEASSPLPEWASPGSSLRQDQLTDLRVALPWAARVIGLEPPHRVGQ